MSARAMGLEPLVNEVVWRLEVLTPLHAGSGDKLVRGLDVESADGWTYVVDLERLYKALPRGGWDRLSDGIAAAYRGSLRDVARYAVRGRLDGASYPDRGATELRAFTRDGFGRPYLPGSTLKGALRTALLGTLADTRHNVGDALRAAVRPQGRGSFDPRGADERVQREAFRLSRSDESTDDVLRHLYVPDVPIPPDCIEIVAVKIASMAEPGAWGWKRRGRDVSNRRDPKEPDVLTLFVEAVRARTVLYVPLRIDAQRLLPGWLKGTRPSEVQDFSAWRSLLTGGGILQAARTHGRRILEPEATMWTKTRHEPRLADRMRALCERLESASGEAVFPIGWGVGWRGMTGAALERLESPPAARLVDAAEEDPSHLAEARRSYPLGKGFRVFPKSRRLATDSDRQPTAPMGWVAARPWAPSDAPSMPEAERPPEGRLGGPAAAPLRVPARPPAHSPGGSTRRPVAVPAPSTEARAGETVRATLLTEKSKKGKWKAKTARGVTGSIEPEGEPTGIAPGQEVELIVKNTASAGQDWSFAWPKKPTR